MNNDHLNQEPSFLADHLLLPKISIFAATTQLWFKLWYPKFLKNSTNVKTKHIFSIDKNDTPISTWAWTISAQWLNAHELCKLVTGLSHCKDTCRKISDFEWYLTCWSYYMPIVQMNKSKRSLNHGTSGPHERIQSTHNKSPRKIIKLQDNKPTWFKPCTLNNNNKFM